MNQFGSSQFENDIEKFKRHFKENGKFGIFIVLGFIALIGINSSFYTVQPDEEAVVIRFGKYVSTNPPGLQFKLPFGVDTVFLFKTKQVLQKEFGFRTKNTRTRRTTYSGSNFDDESLMLTGDLNVADVEWVVQYQIANPFKFKFHTSEPDQNIRDVSESVMRRVVGDRIVTEVLTTGRKGIEIEARDLSQEILNKYDMGVKIVTVKLQDVNPPEPVKPSFNLVNEAKQEQEKVINQAEEAYNKVIPEARGKAEKLVSEAEGYMSGLVNQSLGDAEKFTSVLREYRKAPLITRKRLYLETMEEVFSRLENLVIVDSSVKGLLPIFNKLKE